MSKMRHAHISVKERREHKRKTDKLDSSKKRYKWNICKGQRGKMCGKIYTYYIILVANMHVYLFKYIKRVVQIFDLIFTYDTCTS